MSTFWIVVLILVALGFAGLLLHVFFDLSRTCKPNGETDMEYLRIVSDSWPIAIMFIALLAAGLVLYLINWFKRMDREDKAIRAAQAREITTFPGQPAMTIKDRLLEAIGDMPDLSQDVLTGILIEKVEMLRAELAAARDAVFKEGLRADSIEHSAREEIRRLQNDPLAMAQGDFFFSGGANCMYVVTIAGGGAIHLVRRTGGLNYAYARVAREEYVRQIEKGLI